ncbi:hypothetical protein SDJN03_17198, partial [Cucurbita argyrosperma subsp. sororia]
MSYDDVEIEDMEWNEELQAFTYPCPCGDLFQITKEDLKLGEEIARRITQDLSLLNNGLPLSLKNSECSVMNHGVTTTAALAADEILSAKF